MAATEQSMMEVVIENEYYYESEQEPFGEPTMMCLDDLQDYSQGDGQDDGQDDGEDDDEDYDEDDDEDDSLGDGQDDDQDDGEDDDEDYEEEDEEGDDEDGDENDDDDEDDGEDNCQAKRFRSEQSGPEHERCVHGEINEIWVPLDRREVFFNIAQPYELEPLSRYFFREWSEAAHLFVSAFEYEEEIYDDWSSSRNFSIRSFGL